MRRICLLYNPAAGSNRLLRRDIVEQIASSLRKQRFDVEIVASSERGSAGEQARQACGRGAEIIFACGGDGTIHDVLQGLALLPRVALGIVPLGSANALARHLKLPLDPVLAVQQQLSWEPRMFPLGRVTYMRGDQQASRFFAVMAGAGADGALAYKVLARDKERFGRLSYYVSALLLALTTPFPRFHIGSLPDANGTLSAVSVMAVRVADLGGAFSPMVRGGLLEHRKLRVVVASGPAPFSLATWFALSWLGLARLNRHVRICEVELLEAFEPESKEPVQVQADGEWLGRTPMSVAVVPDALRMLAPPWPV